MRMRLRYRIANWIESAIQTDSIHTQTLFNTCQFSLFSAFFTLCSWTKRHTHTEEEWMCLFVYLFGRESVCEHWVPSTEYVSMPHPRYFFSRYALFMFILYWMHQHFDVDMRCVRLCNEIYLLDIYNEPALTLSHSTTYLNGGHIVVKVNGIFQQTCKINSLFFACNFWFAPFFGWHSVEFYLRYMYLKNKLFALLHYYFSSLKRTRSSCTVCLSVCALSHWIEFNAAKFFDFRNICMKSWNNSFHLRAKMNLNFSTATNRITPNQSNNNKHNVIKWNEMGIPFHVT